MHWVQAEFSEELQPKQLSHFQECSWVKKGTFYSENTGHWNLSQRKCCLLSSLWVLELGIPKRLFRSVLSMGLYKSGEIKHHPDHRFAKPSHFKLGMMEWMTSLLNQGTELRLLSHLISTCFDSTYKKMVFGCAMLSTHRCNQVQLRPIEDSFQMKSEVIFTWKRWEKYLNFDHGPCNFLEKLLLLPIKNTVYV